MLQQVDDGGSDPVDIDDPTSPEVDPSETADVDEGGSGYDDFDHPSDHPTPDNMWDFNSIHCGTACSTYTMVAGFLLFVHLYIMAAPLEGWANGNLILFGNTAMTLIQYAASMAMAWEAETYWHMQKRVRTTVFVLALVSFIGWASTAFASLYR